MYLLTLSHPAIVLVVVLAALCLGAFVYWAVQQPAATMVRAVVGLLAAVVVVVVVLAVLGVLT